MIETDSPDIIPAGADPNLPNEPCTLSLVLQALAEIRDMPASELADITLANTREFFGSIQQ